MLTQALFYVSPTQQVLCRHLLPHFWSKLSQTHFSPPKNQYPMPPTPKLYPHRTQYIKFCFNATLLIASCQRHGEVSTDVPSCWLDKIPSQNTWTLNTGNVKVVRKPNLLCQIYFVSLYFQLYSHKTPEQIDTVISNLGETHTEMPTLFLLFAPGVPVLSSNIRMLLQTKFKPGIKMQSGYLGEIANHLLFYVFLSAICLHCDWISFFINIMQSSL